MSASQPVVVWGPNCPFPDATFHVHASDCADLQRGIYPRLRGGGDQGGYLETHTSVQGLVEDTYADQIDETPGATWENFVNDFHIFPCVTLPHTEPEETPCPSTA